ncbi:hypothetical protein GCM10010921_23740 [Microbacterium album]|uniref:Uncharacterized protein n=1 Tax=Microbacterium album TaxID=2053191 RepID=A0A917IGC2_9MICO|nr:hypothetical protein GCM10010921_23740 [Microbacterium album]
MDESGSTVGLLDLGDDPVTAVIDDIGDDHPRAASSFAVASPIPEPAPVTTATLLVIVIDRSQLVSLRQQ